MSSPDPTSPGGPPLDPPPSPLPPKPPSPANPLNPQLLGNVAVIGALILAGVSIIGMLILSVIYDGAYVQATFQLLSDVVLIALGGTGLTGIAHTLRRLQ